MRFLTICLFISASCAALAQKSRPGFIFRVNYDLHEIYNQDQQESSLLRRTFYSPEGITYSLHEQSSYYGYEIGFEYSLGYRFPNHVTIAFPIGFRSSNDDYQSVYQINGQKELEKVDFTVFSKYINAGVRLIYPITIAENQLVHINMNTLIGLEPKVMISRNWEIRNVGTPEVNYRSSTTVADNEQRWYTDAVCGLGLEFETRKMFYELRTLARTNYREGISGAGTAGITRALSYQIGVGVGMRLGVY